MTDSIPLVLASSSQWRRALMDRLQVPYRAVSPDIDETPQQREDARHLVLRLAKAKAKAVSATCPDAIVIGSDQVACLDDTIIGKPGSRAVAIQQLERQSGRTVIFHTAVCVCTPDQRAPMLAHVPVNTKIRTLSSAQIRRYVELEDVTSTAGSIKSEGLGITLVERISSDDPTALIGLPLISLCQMLTNAGIQLP